MEYLQSFLIVVMEMVCFFPVSGCLCADREKA